MIKLINDVYGKADGGVMIPFVLETDGVQLKDLNVEVIGNIGGTFSKLPSGIVSAVISDGLEENVDVISPELFECLFVLRLNTNEVNVDTVYIRLYNSDISSTSQKINISSLNGLEFSTTPRVLGFKPKSVQVSDTVLCTYNVTISALTIDKFVINILVSKNANSTTPVWANVTDASLAVDHLLMKNSYGDRKSVV